MITSLSGVSTSTSFSLVGGQPAILATGRGSSTTRDQISDFIGGAFSPVATVRISSLANKYVSIGIPVNASSNTITATLADDFGGYDNTVWRFGRWSPADSAYLEVGNPVFTSIAEGQGYWLNTVDGRGATVTGLPAPNDLFSIPLVSGGISPPDWNQVSNPFLYPIPVATLIVTDGATPRFITNAANTYTEQSVRIWDPVTQAFSTLTGLGVINGRTAFWVRKLVGTTVTLYIPNLASPSGSPSPELDKPDGATWAVGLLARQGDRACEPLLVGAAPVAEGVWNALDLARAPAPPGEFLSLHVNRSDWSNMSGDYVRDFRPDQESMTWEFSASGMRAPGDFTLEVKGFDLPSDRRLWLSDADEGWMREVTPGQTLTLTALERPRRLRLTASGNAPAGSRPAADGYRYTYPNPFQSTVGFSFALARGGDVEVGIYDVVGRRVRSLERPGAPAGEHVLTWDGLDDGGRAVPAGVYLARYHAGGVGGVARVVKLQ